LEERRGKIRDLAGIFRELEPPKETRSGEYLCPKCLGKLLVDEVDDNFWHGLLYVVDGYDYYECVNENCDYEYAKEFVRSSPDM